MIGSHSDIPITCPTLRSIAHGVLRYRIGALIHFHTTMPCRYTGSTSFSVCRKTKSLSCNRSSKFTFFVRRTTTTSMVVTENNNRSRPVRSITKKKCGPACGLQTHLRSAAPEWTTFFSMRPQMDYLFWPRVRTFQSFSPPWTPR